LTVLVSIMRSSDQISFIASGDGNAYFLSFDLATKVVTGDQIACDWSGLQAKIGSSMAYVVGRAKESNSSTCVSGDSCLNVLEYSLQTLKAQTYTIRLDDTKNSDPFAISTTSEALYVATGNLIVEFSNGKIQWVTRIEIAAGLDCNIAKLVIVGSTPTIGLDCISSQNYPETSIILALDKEHSSSVTKYVNVNQVNEQAVSELKTSVSLVSISTPKVAVTTPEQKLEAFFVPMKTSVTFDVQMGTLNITGNPLPSNLSLKKTLKVSKDCTSPELATSLTIRRTDLTGKQFSCFFDLARQTLPSWVTQKDSSSFGLDLDLEICLTASELTQTAKPSFQLDLFCNRYWSTAATVTLDLSFDDNSGGKNPKPDNPPSEAASFLNFILSVVGFFVCVVF